MLGTVDGRVLKGACESETCPGARDVSRGQAPGHGRGGRVQGPGPREEPQASPTDFGTFTLSADGTTFTGRWKYSSDPPDLWRTGWNGKRVD